MVREIKRLKKKEVKKHPLHASSRIAILGLFLFKILFKIYFFNLFISFIIIETVLLYIGLLKNGKPLKNQTPFCII